MTCSGCIYWIYFYPPLNVDLQVKYDKQVHSISGLAFNLTSRWNLALTATLIPVWPGRRSLSETQDDLPRLSRQQMESVLWPRYQNTPRKPEKNTSWTWLAANGAWGYLDCRNSSEAIAWLHCCGCCYYSSYDHIVNGMSFKAFFYHRISSNLIYDLNKETNSALKGEICGRGTVVVFILHYINLGI